MAILHVRDVPDQLYERLRERAARERRSLSAEVVVLLQQAIDQPDETPELVYDRIRRRRLDLERVVGRLPSSVDLLREDRER